MLEGLSISRLDKVALTKVLRYLVKRGYVHNTLLQYFAALSGFCDYLIWQGIAEANIVKPFRKRFLRKYKNNPGPERQLIS
ncbi:hypothetical protein GTO27_02190, partial [Candidatus Bathyarchaeota archaeon]|nr:hypothetical protein [Candidatus Bathyarchaeota archaeon]